MRTGLAPFQVNFTNLSANATKFTWSFGDGKTSTNTNPSNTYSNAGVFSVSLTASGNGGTNTLTFTNYITATNAPPVPSFSANVRTGLAPFQVNFTNLSANATAYSWNFGDGNSSTNANPVNTYTNAGVFSVSLIAIGLGGTNSLSFTNYITATNAPPVPVEIMSPEVADGRFGFGFLTRLGANYVIEYKDALSAPDWLTLTNVVGSGALLPVVDPATLGSSRFYRIREQ